MPSSVGTVIAVDKPLQWSSFQVVNKLKWQLRRAFGLKKFKIGHAGTLDPMASGLLLVCVGNATKQIEQLQGGEKCYSGTFVLGATTPCYDLEQAVDRYYPVAHIDEALLRDACRKLTGPIEQVPPLFSAVKVDGRRAYLSARDGMPADIQPKQVTLYEFDITAFRAGSCGDTLFLQQADDAGSVPAPIRERELYRHPQGSIPDGLPQADFRIRCSKGTYIRSVARDLGMLLDSGAFLGALRRESIGDYSLVQALKIDDIETLLTPDNPQYAFLKEL